MSKEDVTRAAVVAASKKVAAATDKLKLILFTGPDQVLLTPREIQKKIEAGNDQLLPYAGVSPDSTDDSILESMAANREIRRRNGTSRS